MNYKKEYYALKEEFEQWKMESVKWSIEDFTSYPGYKISKRRAQQALEHMIHKHDAEFGISWTEVEFYLDMYGTNLERRKKINHRLKLRLNN
jgi:hypothetical protein